MDLLSKEKRSQLMAQIKSKNTKPEIYVRKYLHSLGFRFRLDNKELPGKPDIRLPKHNTLIFINGCFWHQHKRCGSNRLPKSNLSYWVPKLTRNIKRDKLNKRDLKKLGWNVITIWECDIKSPKKLKKEIEKIIRH